MELALKAGAVLALMVAVGGLTLAARRRNYDGVRRHYTSRRTRVPVALRKDGEADDDDAAAAP